MNPPIGPQWVKPITQIVKEATEKATLDAWEETKRTWKSGFLVKYTEYLYSDWKRNLISLLALIQLFLFNVCQWGIPLSIFFFRKISMFGLTFENFTVVTFFFSKLQLILLFQEETVIIIATKKRSFVKSSSLHYWAKPFRKVLTAENKRHWLLLPISIFRHKAMAGKMRVPECFGTCSISIWAQGN